MTFGTDDLNHSPKDRGTSCRDGCRHIFQFEGGESLIALYEMDGSDDAWIESTSWEPVEEMR